MLPQAQAEQATITEHVRKLQNRAREAELRVQCLEGALRASQCSVALELEGGIAPIRSSQLTGMLHIMLYE